MSVNVLSRLFGAALVVGGIASAASAAVSVGVPVNDNFEYANQAAFEVPWVPIGTTAPISAVLSTAQAKSPIKSINTPGTLTNGQNRNRRTFAETGTLGVGELINWSFDFYEIAATNNPQRNYANLQDSTAPGSSNQLISMGLNNNLSNLQDGGNFFMARILGYTPTFSPPVSGPANPAPTSGAYFKLNDPGATPRTTGWHNLKVELSNDGVGPAGSMDYRFYVDNVLSKTILNVGTTLRSWDNIALGSGLSNSNVQAFFDNMQLQVLPEPTSLAAIGLGVLALGTRRRRA